MISLPCGGFCLLQNSCVHLRHLRLKLLCPNPHSISPPKPPVRVGFKHCYQQKDYTTILVVAEMIPDSVLNEDEQLQMIYDTAVTRTGGGE